MTTAFQSRAALAPLTIGIAGLLFCWPLARYGYPANTDDAQWHVNYSELFLRGLSKGVIYPRWLADMNDGLGSPIFYFYPPLAYYLTSLLGSVTGDQSGLGMLAMAVAVILVASGMTAYAWLRLWVGRPSATAGAVLYMAMPYHLMIDLWTRSAFTEFAAFVWVPLMFLAVEDVRAGRPRGVPLLSLIAALLMVTHLITAMLCAGVLVLYLLLRFRDPLAFARAGGAAVVGLGLAAVYLIPVLTMRSGVLMLVPPLSNGVFLFAQAAGLGEPPRVVLWVALDLLFFGQVAVCLFLLVCHKAAPAPAGRVGLICAGIALILLLSMVVWFAPLWRLLPVLRNVQYPFRVDTIVDFAIVTSTAILIDGLIDRRLPLRWLPPACLVGFVVLGVVQPIPPILRGNFGAPNAHFEKIVAVRFDSGVFRPLASVSRLPVDRAFEAGTPVQPDTPRLQAGDGATAVVRNWSPGLIDADVEATRPTTLDVGQLYFEPWKAWANGVALPVGPSPDLGLIRVQVPVGHSRIVIRLGYSQAEKWGWTISIVSVLLWFGLLGYSRRRIAGFGSGGMDARHACRTELLPAPAQSGSRCGPQLQAADRMTQGDTVCPIRLQSSSLRAGAD